MDRILLWLRAIEAIVYGITIAGGKLVFLWSFWRIVNTWTQEIIQSDLHQAPNTKGKTDKYKKKKKKKKKKSSHKMNRWQAEWATLSQKGCNFVTQTCFSFNSCVSLRYIQLSLLGK